MTSTTPPAPPAPAVASSGRRSLLRHGRPPLVIGHRGASADAPENTMAAFTACWDAGATWLETDVQPSADLVPVLFHDDELDRTSTGTGPLRNQSIAQLSRLDAGSWFSPDFTGQSIPTLYALLAALPAGADVMLEVKGPHSVAALITELAVIHATGTDARVWLSSFEVDALRSLAAAVPGIWLGLLREDALDDDPVAACRDFHASSYQPDYKLLLERPEIVGPLHSAGISVLVWTADDPANWEQLTKLGVDGIITNRPGALLSWQRQHQELRREPE